MSDVLGILLETQERVGSGFYPELEFVFACKIRGNKREKHINLLTMVIRVYMDMVMGKPVQATKPTRLKTKAKVAKSKKKKQPTKKPKAKGLAVLSKVTLTKAEQLKLATKRSKTQFHSSHASGSGDGVDTQSKVPDEQQQKTSGIDEGIDKDDESVYVNKSDGNDIDDGSSDDHDDSDDERTESDRDEIPNPNLTNIYDEENIDEEEEDEVTKELYDDVNVNLGNEDTKMTNVDQGALEQQNASQQSRFEQEEEDAQMTLTPVLDTQKIGGLTQSSFVSSDFISKLLNLDNPSPADNEIASLMDTTAHHATTIPEITSSFSTPTPPPPLFFNPLSQQATPTPTPKDSETTTSLPAPLDFAYVFKFNERVSNLEKDLLEIKQVDQGVETTKTKIKTPPLDQTKGQKEESQAKKLNHSEIQGQRKRILYVPLKMPPNLNISLLANLRMRKSNTIEDLGVQQDQEFDTDNNDEQPTNKEVTKANWFKKPERPPTPDPDWSKRQQVDR
nr:hypothetical protein [Tanacetum cinerariifolium]